MSVRTPDRVYEMAAEWHGRLSDDSVSASVRAEFEAWISENPQHRAAYHAVERSWEQLANTGSDVRILELRREALTARGRTPWSRVAAAAVLAAALMGTAYLTAPLLGGLRLAGIQSSKQQAAFVTAVGEQSNVALADGSSLVLNTDSRVEVSFTPERRHVRLLRGQAWFQVAKSSGRPFVVDAGDQRITALGTAFEVRVDARKESVQVTLAEGRVRVERRNSPLQRLIDEPAPFSELVPGESLVVSPETQATKQVVDLAMVSHWRSGQIVFDDATLGHAVEEVNRYSSTQIVLADESLTDLRVSGVFKAGHSQSFIETVTAHYPIEITARTEDRILLIRKAAEK